MMFNETFFGPAPETFEAVDVNFTGCKSHIVIDLKMPVTTKHQTIIASKFVGVNDVPLQTVLTVSPISVSALSGTTVTRTVPFRSRMPNTGTLPAASLAFASATKIAFIELNFTTQ